MRQLADPSGSILLSQTFDAYGNLYQRSAISGADPSSFGWTGQQSDPNGLTYLRARYYQPSMGRFTQIDPFDGALAVPASMNGYGYAHGNSVRYTDPSGEFPILLALAIIGAAAFGGAAYGYQVHSNMQQGMDFWNAAYYKNINWRTVGIATGVGAVALPLAYLGLQALPYAYVYMTSTLPTYASYLYGANVAPTAFGLNLTAGLSLTGAMYATYGAPMVSQAMPYIPPLAAASYIYANESGWIPPEMHREISLGVMAGYEMWRGERITAAMWSSQQARKAVRLEADAIIARRLANLNELAEENIPEYVFRGTSAGFPGRHPEFPYTPVSTDPAVGTLFATHGDQFGEGVLHVVNTASLHNVEILPGSYLGPLERELRDVKIIKPSDR